MVLTRSQSGDSRREQTQEEPSVTAGPGASSSAPESSSVGVSGTGSGSTTTTNTDTTRTHGTLKPVETRSHRSTSSKKKRLAELEARERLAEMKVKQAQAERELQEIQLQRIRTEAESSEDEDLEDDLASVRIGTWLARPAPPPEVRLGRRHTTPATEERQRRSDGHRRRRDGRSAAARRRRLRRKYVFWRRWVREYLPLLQNRREPYGSGTPPKVGDVVVICDSNLPRNTWPKGRVTQVLPGADGEIRVVDVMTRGLVLRRPTKRIVVLPTESPEGDGGRSVHDRIIT
ncbi:hypothetical protein HF086_014255 [Spodoptera exigua]|uniref:DUF5641 domain-containing protein n=1 Tax=Spodoptera exigua TaxID=7107 RepID=A0A922M7T3_SPOEX|nr:hypothetical protein HF086_014255 [Spodoptera exigua]